jgi:hypothetical protein
MKKTKATDKRPVKSAEERASAGIDDKPKHVMVEEHDELSVTDDAEPEQVVEIDDDDDDDDDAGDGGDICKSDIKKCVAVARMLIKSPRITRSVDSIWVQQSFWDAPTALTDVHFDFMAKIVNLLRPFYPQDLQKGKSAPRHVLLSIKMVALANFVLSRLGYPVHFLIANIRS